MPPAQRTNLYPDVPNKYIYLQANGRYSAYRRYPDPSYGPYQPKKYFNKGGLFYTLEDARAWLETLPEKMERPYRNAPSED